jgi:hypothetical protein
MIYPLALGREGPERNGCHDVTCLIRATNGIRIADSSSRFLHRKCSSLDVLEFARHEAGSVTQSLSRFSASQSVKAKPDHIETLSKT